MDTEMDKNEIDNNQTVSDSLSSSLNNVDLSEAAKNEQKFFEFENFSKFYDVNKFFYL